MRHTTPAFTVTHAAGWLLPCQKNGPGWCGASGPVSRLKQRQALSLAFFGWPRVHVCGSGCHVMQFCPSTPGC